jgi:uncharacterized protein (DUF1499 family)
MAYRMPKLKDSGVAKIAESMAWISIPLMLIGILLTRARLIEPMAGISIVAAAASLAMSAIAVAVVASIEIWNTGRNGLGAVLRASIVAMLVVAYPGYLAVQSLRLPRITDVSTDIEDAPAFSRTPAVMAARQGHHHSALEARQRAAQLRAYPDIRTLQLELDPEDAFRLVKEALGVLKWQIIAEVPPGPRSNQAFIEVIAETRLMRFRDDLVIRIRPAGNETKIDIRSASRVGRHDFGGNASRIRRLIEEITANRE